MVKPIAVNNMRETISKAINALRHIDEACKNVVYLYIYIYSLRKLAPLLHGRFWSGRQVWQIPGVFLTHHAVNVSLNHELLLLSVFICFVFINKLFYVCNILLLLFVVTFLSNARSVLSCHSGSFQASCFTWPCI